MQAVAQELRRRYESWPDEKLLELHHHGQLPQVARTIFSEVLTGRGVLLPALPRRRRRRNTHRPVPPCPGRVWAAG